MATRLLRVTTLLLIGLALTADSAFSQGRRDRDNGRQDTGRSAEPRGGGRVDRGDGGGRADRGNGGGRREAGPPANRGDYGGGRRIERQPSGADYGGERRTARQPGGGRQPRIDVQPRPEIQQRAEIQPRTQVEPRRDSQPRFQNRGGSGDRSGWDGRYRDTDRRAVPRTTPYYRDSRDRDDRYYRGNVRPRVVVPQYRNYGGYRSYPRRTYMVPYGYRPYGYRPGWSFNLYFGRPYGRHLYGGSPYGYDYGYYAIDPGFAYGSLRIVDAPRYAQVFVDGYYAGEVDDYDGIFQRLNLEAGPHHIEIVIDEGVPPLEFDVQIIPGETVTYHARF